MTVGGGAIASAGSAAGALSRRGGVDAPSPRTGLGAAELSHIASGVVVAVVDGIGMRTSPPLDVAAAAIPLPRARETGTELASEDCGV